MDFFKASASVFIPDGVGLGQALERTTHLAIGAHADDLEFFAYHGIAACYGHQDQWFTGITVTDGAGSTRSGPYADKTDEELVAIRRKEQERAAQIGKYAAVIQLGYSSAETKDPENPHPVDDLLQILKTTKPRILYLHNPADKHDTHVAVLIKCLHALRKMKAEDRPSLVYGCEGWRDLDWLPDADKVALPTSDRPELQTALNGVFDSQIAGGKRYDLAVMGRRRAHATFFDSHAGDAESGLTFAVDLTPLIRDDSLSLESFICQKIRKFEEDVSERIRKF